MKEKLQPQMPNDKRVTQKGAGSRAECTSTEHPVLHNGTSEGKKILMEHSPGPKQEQFNLGLEGEILTQTSLPWALPVPSVPWPCATARSDPVLHFHALVPPLCSCLHSTSYNQHKFTQISTQHQTKIN